MESLAQAALVWAITTAAAFGAGAVTAAVLKSRTATVAGALSQRLALGYGALGTALFWLGVAHRLGPEPIGCLLGAGVVAAAITAGSTIWRWHRAGLRLPAPRCRQRRPAAIAAWGGVAVILVAALPRALGPETEGDALCYHIELPKQFVRLGRLAFMPWTDQSLFPALTDLCFSVPLALLDGSPLLRLFPFTWGVALVLAVAELAATTGYRPHAALAALLIASAPIVTNHATVAYNDLPVALFGTWALIWLIRWMHCPTVCHAVLAGLFLGFAAATKLTGLAWALCLCATAIAVTAASRQLACRRRALGLVAALTVALLVAGPWYARAWYHTGNPFHPYFASLFPSAANIHDWRPVKPLPVSLTNPQILALPLLATLFPERFGGAGQQWGVVFLAFLPAALLIAARRRGGRLALAAAVLYTILWLAAKQNLRFLLPVLPIAVLWCVAGLDWLRSTNHPLARAAITGVLVVQLAAGLAAPLRRSLPYCAFLLGRQSLEEFLATHEPTYRVATWLAARVPPGMPVLTQEHRLFYFDRPLVREDALRRWLGYDSSSPALLAALESLGFRYILLARSLNHEVARYDQSLRERLRRAVDSFEPIGTMAFCSPGGDRRVYELFRFRASMDGRRSFLLRHPRWQLVKDGLRWFAHGYGGRAGSGSATACSRLAAAAEDTLRQAGGTACEAVADAGRSQSEPCHLRVLRPPVLALPHGRLRLRHVPGSSPGFRDGSGTTR